MAYLKSIVTGNPKRFLGHNPAGGMMVLALLTVLGTTTLSGMKLYAIEEGEHLDKKDKHHEEEKDGEEFWEEVHETSINLLMLLILLHVLGVVLASKQHKKNLARAMITADKAPLN
jgi:cytochrome b